MCNDLKSRNKKFGSNRRSYKPRGGSRGDSGGHGYFSKNWKLNRSWRPQYIKRSHRKYRRNIKNMIRQYNEDEGLIIRRFSRTDYLD